MKSSERHKIKENEFAQTVARTRDMVNERPREVATIAIAVLGVAIAVGGFFAWRASRDGKATSLLASALAVAEAPVVTPPPPAPGSPPPIQPPGSYRTERERLEAAVPLLQRAADAYPNNDAGITARYRLAASLAELGRYSEAEQRYQEVADKAGRSIYGRTARLGVADVQVAQGKYDNAITIYTEISRDPNAQIPVDGVLMQLGRAYTRAGKKDEAAGAFNRVINDFPESLFTADARRELELVKKS